MVSQAYHSIRQNQRAIADYDKGIKIDPNFALAYNNRGINRGIAYGDLGRYERAIQLDSGFAMAYYNRGVAYGFLGSDSEAYADERKTCSLDSEYC